jgi:LmbE family N-acetylglucosaminyl deacetylase
MEDHMNTCRLVVTAAFVRGIPNYKAGSSTPTNVDCTIYHALPHGLKDPLRKKVNPGIFVDVSSVYDTKLQALSAHKSQHEWLDSSQKMNSYLRFLEDIARKVGEMSGSFKYAEGWRRHLHYGFGSEDADPLRDLGRNYLLNEAYEVSLK